MKLYVRLLILLLIVAAGVLTIFASGGGARFVDPLFSEAGRDKYVKTGDVVWLNGTGSNFHDNVSQYLPLLFRWGFISWPEGSQISLVGTNAVFDSFIPDIAGEYVFEVNAYSGETGDSYDRVTITATTPAEDSTPNAHAGPIQIAQVGNVVFVDGRQSYDPDGNILSSTVWTMNSPPTSNAALYDSNAISTYFTPDVPGTYRLSLMVASQQGGVGDELTDRDDTFVIVTGPELTPVPIANAGYGLDQYVKTGSTVNLDGSASYDAQGNTLDFQWRLLTYPGGSNVELLNANSVFPSFVADVDGTYVVRLEVSNNEHSSLQYKKRDEMEYRDRIVVVADSDNSWPMARVGVDQTILLGQEAIVDGSASYDADDDSMTHLWELVSVAGSHLTPPTLTYSLTGDRARFTPQHAGTYAIRLVVNDGRSLSLPAISLVHVRDDNNPPVANAGEDQTVSIGNDVSLDGSASSDPDGHPVTYLWSIVSVPEGSSATLSDPTSVSPSYHADVDGQYVFKLIVNDNLTDSLEDSVIITVPPPQVGDNNPPTANAGLDDVATPNILYTLNGSNSSDPDGDTLLFSWSILSQPSGSDIILQNSDTAMPSFTSVVIGNYEFALIVNDGLVDSIADRVIIFVNNTRPVANAGVDDSATINVAYTLDGSNSSDTDDNPLLYTWRVINQPVGANTMLEAANTVSPSFFPELLGEYEFGLIVNDGHVDSLEDTVIIDANNSPPIANAGPDQNLASGVDFVFLDGSGSSDPDGDNLTYLWSFLISPGPNHPNITNPSDEKPNFIPSGNGTYRLQLVVNDGKTDSSLDIVAIKIGGGIIILDSAVDRFKIR